MPAVGTAVELRSFIYVDVLQPQLAAFNATVAQGYLPKESQASLYVEVAPGIAINTVTDAAIKRTGAQPGLLIVERSYGLLELHSFDQAEIRAAGEAILETLGCTMEDRLAPRVVSCEVITGISDYQAMMLNQTRHGDSILAGQSLFVLECHPAGYAAFAANEAEKAATVHLMEVTAFGAFGRLFMAGSEAEIQSAAQAAVRALGQISGRPNAG